jgi:hypothetical protein
MIVAIVALVVAMVGTGYAASLLPKNSVGTKQIKKNAVTGAKVKNQTLTGKDINVNKLGTVPSANVANGFASFEALHLVGTSGNPPFLSGSKNYPPLSGLSLQPVGFFKDHDGVVHLEGIAEVGAEGSLPGVIFTLPPGFRPENGLTQIYEPLKEKGVFIFGSNVVLSGFDLSGDVYAPSGATALLSGITFRAGS